MELISQVTIDDSVYLATDLIELASKKEKLSDKRRKSQFSRLLNNSKTLETTMHLTDEVMRISSSKASGKILRNINQKVTYKGLGFIDFFGLFRSLENCGFLLLSENFSFFEASSIKSVARYTESSIVTCEINSILYLFYYV